MKTALSTFSLFILVLLTGCGLNQGPQATTLTATLNPPYVASLSITPSPAVPPTAEPTDLAPTGILSSSGSAATPPQIAALESTPQVSPPIASPVQPPANNPNATDSCSNKMAFFADVTVPDGTVFKQGETFTKTWRLRNEGTCTIDSSYSLVFASGDPLNGPLTAPMPEIMPGQVVDLSLNLSAPSQGGVYAANYEFQDAKGNRFGVNSNGIDTIWVEIKVDWVVKNQTADAAASNATLPVTGNCSYSENPAYLDQILTLVNNARTAEGVQALTANPLLMAAAKAHSIDMGCNNFLDHTGSDGTKARDRMIAQGYTPSYSAENIYAGETQYGADAQGAFDWWMNSPVHRKNILNPRPTEVGIGYVNVPGSNFGGYYTMVFAKP